MMHYNIAFAPDLPLWAIITIITACLLLVLWGLFLRLRGSILRAIAGTLLAIAILNPSLHIQDREQLKSIVAIVTDNTGSQNIDGRAKQTQAIKNRIIESISKNENFEIRQIDVTDQFSTDIDISTALFEALKTGLSDVPSKQIAGSILITDGQVHDIPKAAKSLNFDAPIHAIITGEKDEKDQQIKILEAPRYTVVGQSYEISYEIIQEGFDKGEEVEVSIFIDGELYTTEPAIAGEVFTFVDELQHGGKNIIEFKLAPHKDELTEANNRVFTTINGIRENLRVLLVSGEPHIGERTWRNLLKSDASVDLVHFTILRPPEKQDGTPINELSLIAFPTRELFVEKIDEFDLIIFDRYSRRGVLPILYFDNIARYVRDGGAILIAAGPEFGVSGSIAQTPLASVLPALPTGKMRQKPFKPIVSKLGKKHPVTRGLDTKYLTKEKPNDPNWSEWFRSISVGSPTGDVVMEGTNKSPLLVLQHFDKGRVALLLSDHAWLWARGFDGGGPHVQLLRRISHWLMKEPELEEERLIAQGNGNKISIIRQTLKADVPPVAILSPSGEQLNVTLSNEETSDVQKGIFKAEVEVSQIGLYQITNGDLTALTHIGPPNPKEFSNVVSTMQLLKPIVEKTGGKIMRVSKSINNLPRIMSVRNGATTKGNGWIGLKNTNTTILKGVNRVSLFSGLFGLALLIFSFAAVWTREGR